MSGEDLKVGGNYNVWHRILQKKKKKKKKKEKKKKKQGEENQKSISKFQKQFS